MSAEWPAVHLHLDQLRQANAHVNTEGRRVPLRVELTIVPE
jgi:hypothetical protein